MGTLTTRILAGLLVLGAALVAAPVHAASPVRGGLTGIPITPVHIPSIVVQTPGPSTNGFYVNGTGFTPGGDIRIYTYAATTQYVSTWYSAADPALRVCTLGSCFLRPGGGFHVYVFTQPCQQTVNEIAYDVTTNQWSNWAQGQVSCIGAP